MTLSATIAGSAVTIVETSFQFGDKVDDRSKCSFRVLDSAGNANFTMFQPVVVTDSVRGTVFTGIVYNPQMIQRLWPSSSSFWQIQCTDQTYRLDKRSSDKVYNNQYAGTIAADQIQRYATGEHISGPFALGWYEAFTEWQSGTMSGTTATTNAFGANPGDGDVELALAGSVVSKTATTTADWSAGAGTNAVAANNTLTLASITGLMVTGTNAGNPGGTSASSFAYTIWTGSYAVVSNDNLSYTMWISGLSPQVTFALEATCSDGTKLSASNALDSLGFSCAPGTNLKGFADSQWYQRAFNLSSLVGKTLVNVQIAVTGTQQGQYTAYFHDIQVVNGVTQKIAIYTNNGTLTTSALSQKSGFTNIMVSFPTVYPNTSDGWSATIDISPAAIYQSSLVTWRATVPTGSAVTATIQIMPSSTYPLTLPVTQNSALPGFVAGQALSTAAGAPQNYSIFFQLTLSVTGTDPTVAPVVSTLQVQVNPSYKTTKTDLYSANQYGGTYSNTSNTLFNGVNFVYLTGSWQDWSKLNGYDGTATLWGSNSPAKAIIAATLQLSTGTGTDVRQQWNQAGNWQNFTMSMDIQIPASTNESIGCVYRTTFWGNGNNTFAWVVDVFSNAVKLSFGSNSNVGGALTNVSNVAISLTAGSWHTLTVIANGTNHQVLIDGVTYVNVTNANFNISGGVGLRANNSSGSTKSYFFQYAGIVASLTGAYTTPSLSLNSVGIVGGATLSVASVTNSIVGAPGNQLLPGATVVAQTSTDAGATWQAVTNGVVTGLPAGTNVAGKSILIRFTLTATDATRQPYFNAYALIVSSQYSASGTWSTAPFASDTFTRGNLAGSFGTASDGETYTHPAGTDTLSISGNKGVVTSNASAAANRMLLGSGTLADCEGLVRITIGSVSDAVGIILRSDSTSANHYVARNSIGSTTGDLEIAKRVAGTFTSLGIHGGGAALSNGAVFWLKFRAQGSTLSVKSWIDGTTEPTNFAWSITDSSFASGQYGLYCAQAPTVPESFDTFTITRYPNPALSLASVGRAAYSLVNWNANLPTGTGLVVATSIDKGASWQTVASAGNAISGISLQPAPVVDTFASNTSANYTQSNFGGTTGSWTWDTANSRLSGSGGNGGTLVNSTALTAADNQVLADLDQADGSGLIVNYQSASAMYYIQIWDASGTGTQNSVKLFKRSGGVSSQLGSTAVIAFPRGTHHFFILDVQAGVLTVSMDGVQLIQQTDGSPLAAGKSGLLLGTLVRCYDLLIQQYGQNVSALTVYTRLTLSTTDPTVTPQILDLQTFCSAVTFGAGTLIPNAPYNTDKSYVSSDIEDLKNQSQYWWNVGMIADGNGNYPVSFTSRTAVPAPWPLDENNYQIIGGQQIGDILLANLSLSNSASLYRNRQKIKGAIATATFTQTFAGDGKTRTWNTANPLVAAPIVTLNNQAVTLGVQGVDSGRQFYYQIGSTSLTQDNSGTILSGADVLQVFYTGSYEQDVVRNNTSFPGTLTQSGLAAITGDSGIVENIVSVSGQNMSVAAATTYADQLLQRFGVAGLTLVYTTMRPGLAPGQQQPIYAPTAAKITDVQMLITDVQLAAQTSSAPAGGVLNVFTVTCQTGPALGSWVKLLASGLNS